MPAPLSPGAPAALATWTMSLFLIVWTYPALVLSTSSLYFPILMSSDVMSGFPPCAATISRNFLSASPELRILLASSAPCGIPPISRIMPARSHAFSTTLDGCPFPSRMRMHSLASRPGPIALPTGWSPYVIAHSTCMPSLLPSSMKSWTYALASSIVLTLVPSPVGISIRRCVAPMASFLLMMDASICARGLIFSGYSTLMSMSSTGARFMEPPHASTPPTSSAILFRSVVFISTLQKVSTKSEVPHALLMARDDVFGSISPAAATMETTMGVTLFPGTPPTLWKSNTGVRSNSILSPVLTIATVMSAISSTSIPLMYRAVSHADTSISDNLASSISLMTALISSLVSFWPSIFFLMLLTDSGLGENTTFTSIPSLAPIFSITFFGIRISPGFTSESDLLAVTTYDLDASMRTLSPSLIPISLQSSSWMMTLRIEASRS